MGFPGCLLCKIYIAYFLCKDLVYYFAISIGENLLVQAFCDVSLYNLAVADIFYGFASALLVYEFRMVWINKYLNEKSSKILHHQFSTSQVASIIATAQGKIIICNKKADEMMMEFGS